MAKTNFENLRVFQLAERLADEVWSIVIGWKRFARWTVGRQVIRSADSVGANIAEGVGRGTYKDNKRFVRTARGSLNETQYWLRRAYRRQLLTTEETERLKQIIDELAPTLNAYLRSIGQPKKSTDN